MSNSVALLFTDIMIIGFISALIVAAGILFARKEDRERAVAARGTTFSKVKLGLPTSGVDGRSGPPLPIS